MTKLTSWYKVVTPREDLRSGKPLDASEFAVHLDQVRDGTAPEVYQNPRKFFERTYLTKNLLALSTEVIRRLSGEKTETSAVFNMATQFGGGKTHSLTMLYHLASLGSEANKLPGVQRLLTKAGLKSIPKAATAVFVGTEFDPFRGRGGEDGTPLRRTPWGEIAYQLNGEKGLACLTQHEENFVAPGGDVIREFLPKDTPCLILLDELMNYISRAKKKENGSQLYNFLHNLSEIARGMDNVVLAVSIPASELEMNADEQTEYNKLKKLLDRLGKAIVMSSETETSEIIRRRLFEWEETDLWSGDSIITVPNEAKKTCKAYTEWLQKYRKQLPDWFPVDNAQELFEATYPFHPMVLSVFERKWQTLPRFQQTRGVLRLLALWVSKAYSEGYNNNQAEPLISLGSAPLDDTFFRSAILEQLGETRLEGVITSDICGKPDSHAIRLDKETEIEVIKKSRLHKQVATSIFFESNGGQTQNKTTSPEVRMSVSKPDLDIENVTTVLESLVDACYYLSVENSKYKFSMQANLNKILSDRRASVQPAKVEELIRNDIQKVFSKTTGVEVILFPQKSQQIPDRPVITLAILPFNQTIQESDTLNKIETMTKEYGSGARTFKSALIWVIPDNPQSLIDEARKLLALKAIEQEQTELKLDDLQRKQLNESLKKAERDLKEAIWRTYKNVRLLSKDHSFREVDLGLVNSSQSSSMVNLIINRLQQEGDITDAISPNFILRNWSPAFKEWNTKAIRDAFFAAPQFPRLLNQDAIKNMIVRGVTNGNLAYVGKRGEELYEPFIFQKGISVNEIEISEDMYLITQEIAQRYLDSKTKRPEPEIKKEPEPVKENPYNKPDQESKSSGERISDRSATLEKPEEELIIEDNEIEEEITSNDPKTMSWNGNIPSVKWMTFYQKALVSLVKSKGLELNISVKFSPEDGLTQQKIDEFRTALRELGLDDNIRLN